MLETLLAIVVIAMVSFGVYTLYRSASGSGNIQQTEQAIQQISSGALTMINTSFGNPPTQAGVYMQGSISSAYKAGSSCSNSTASAGACFQGPWGDIGYTSNADTSNQSFYITVKNVPEAEGPQLCRDMISSYDILVSGTQVTVDTCTTTTWDTTNTVKFYYPAGIYSAD